MLIHKILSDISRICTAAIPDSSLQVMADAGVFAIWGTGRAAEYALKLCKEHGISPVCVCDSFFHPEGERFYGLPLLSEQAFFSRFPGCLVLICCVSSYGIDQKLRINNHPYIIWNTDLVDNFSGDCSLDKLYQNNQEKIEKVYSLLADEKSKQSYENILRFRLTLEAELLRRVHDPSLYFNNSVIQTVQCATFVDCGAYDGDTLASFFSQDRFHCTTYYALEPEAENYRRLQNYVERRGLSTVKLYQAAAWSENKILHFGGSREGAKVITEGGISVIGKKLDDLLERDTVGFIKMDIEGSEIPALRGALSIIQRDKPVLAVSIYHHKEDLWNIPLLLHEMNPDYKLFVRHHTFSVDDTVCYAL